MVGVQCHQAVALPMYWKRLGVNLTLTPEQVGHSVDQIGIGFMFAPNFHGAMKYAAPVRRELGVRTMFNVLGPLTNPAGANNQVLGVFHPDLVGIQARVLQRLGSNHVLVVNGSDGLDEITISGPTHIAELKDGQVNEYSITPEEFGFQSATLDSIRVTNVEEAKAMLLGVLDNHVPERHATLCCSMPVPRSMWPDLPARSLKG
jgi:anthranilate phosphoribosyltransferase